MNRIPTVDVWSLNIYRGANFGGVFEQWASISPKPMFLGEFGTDAWRATQNAVEPPGFVDEAMQAGWDIRLWNDIARNLSSRDPSLATISGTVFEWNDEWWKVPPPASQQTAGAPFPPWSHPDGRASSEEYFGLVTIGRTARQAYDRMRAAFRPPAVTYTFKATSRGYKAQEYSGQYGVARFFKSDALMHEQHGGPRRRPEDFRSPSSTGSRAVSPSRCGSSIPGHRD